MRSRFLSTVVENESHLYVERFFFFSLVGAWPFDYDIYHVRGEMWDVYCGLVGLA